MIRAVLLPTLFIGLISLAMIKHVTDSNNVEYIDSQEYQQSSGKNRYSKTTQFYSTKLAKKNTKTKFVASQNMQKFAKKTDAPIKKVAAPAKPKKVLNKTKKKSQKTQNFKFASQKEQKNNKDQQKSKRKPSQAHKEKEKFQVPENLPQVNQHLYSTYGVVDNSQSSNQGINYSSGAVSGNNQSPTPPPAPVTITEIDYGSGASAPIESEILSAQAVSSFNHSISTQLEVYEPLIIERIKTEMTLGLKSFFEENTDYGISLNEIKKIDFVLAQAPFGVEPFIKDGLLFKFPLNGSWNIKVTMDLHFENDMFKTDETVQFSFNRFKLAFPMRFQRSNTGQVSLVQHYGKQLSYDINVNSSSFLITTLAEAMNLFYPDFLKDKVSDFIDQLALNTKPLVNKTLVPLRSNIAQTLVKQPPLNLEQTIQNIDSKILTHHLDLQSVHAIEMNSADQKSWQEAYKKDGLQINGSKQKELSFDNSAYLTGLYLASMSYKYRSQSRNEHLLAIKRVLNGISNLFKIHGDSGLMARSIMPYDSQLAQDLIAGGAQIGDTLVLGEIDNVSWLAYQGQGISLDQYQGVLYGLVTAYNLVDDENIKTEVSRLTKIMVDYLIKENFIFEYEKLLIQTANMKPAKSIWESAHFHKLAFIQAAAKMHPGRYDNELEQIEAINASAWLDVFYQILNPVQNFKKLELSLLNLATYYDVSDNQEQKKEVSRVVDMIDFYLGHNRNIFLDSLIIKIQPEKIIDKADKIRKGLAHFLERPHRLTRTTSLNRIETVTVTLPNGEEIEVTTNPLLPEQMVLDSEFLWQNSAQIKNTAEENNARVEAIGLDATLPFWMGMNTGVF